ncbi:hypothetical protein, partial [Pseudomonas sp.]|uniref:hypothetical protein n=1 Tax=Pseudomonas sp. TaxID=306 RepID=UPI0025F76C4C
MSASKNSDFSAITGRQTSCQLAQQEEGVPVLIVDLILLTAVLGIAGWRLFASACLPRMRGVSIALTVLLATGEYALYGFTW